MFPSQLLIKIAKILEDLKIPYMVTGGFAVSVWGRPRFTADIDIVVKLLPKNIPRLAKLLLAIDKDVYVSQEAMENALKRKGEFNFIHPQTGLKVDFWVEKDIEKYYLSQYQDSEARVSSQFEKIKLQRRIPKKIEDQKVYFISPEDLILSKLIWYKQGQSEQQLRDIESVLKVSKSEIDMDYIKNWAERLSFLNILENLIK